MKYKVITTCFVNYGELERFVQKTYGLSQFEVAPLEECGNDSNLAFTPSKDGYPPHGWLDTWNNLIEKKGNVMYSTWAVIEKLWQDGHLPLHKIVVEVSW